MKKFSAVFYLIFAMFIFVSCNSGLKFENPNDPNNQSADTGESSGDDTSDSSSDNGSNIDCSNGDFKCRNDRVSLSCMDGKWLSKECDTDETCNTGTGKCETKDGNDKDSDNNSDNDQGRKQGELYGECYPNKTCNDGLICDKDNNICIKDSESSENNDDDSDFAPDNDTTPAPVTCTGFSIDPDSFRYENGEYHATIPDIADSDESLEDELVIEFRLYDDPQVKTYKLYYDQDDYTSYHNGSYLECDQCVSVFQDIKDGKPTKHFFQESGTLEITETDDSNGIKGSLTAKLVEVTLDKEGESDQVPNGACFEVEGLLFDNICVPNCEGKVCGSDGCGGTCGPNNGVCQGENMACSADQTKCEKYECAQVTVNMLYIINSSNEKLYYGASFNQTIGSETAENKEAFTLKIRGLSMKKETDLASMSFINNCYASVGGTPVPGQPELSSVCMSVQDKSDGYRFYFPNKGTINITTLDSNGNLSAELSGVRLVEIDTANRIPKAGGKCLDITNETLSYTK